MQAIVGIDIGTSNIKVTAFDFQGNPIYSTSRQNKIIEQGSYYDLDGAYIVEQVLEMLDELIENDVKIASIGISSMAESLFPVSEEKSIKEKTMVWHDKRSQKEQKDFHENFSKSKFYNITGLNSEYLFSIFKLLWYYNHRSNLFKETDNWLPVNSYVTYKLTGEKAMDYSLASRTGALDIKKRDWSQKILKNLPFDSSIFPPLKESGKKIGTLKKKYRKKLGIDYEIPISLGGHDHICGSFAVASFQGKVILDSMGTSENILGIGNLKQLDLEKLYNKGLNFGSHVVPGQIYVYQAFNYSSVIINNIISMFFNKPVEDLEAQDFEKFNKEARKFQDKETTVKLFIEQNEDRFLENQKLKDLNLLNIPLNIERGEVFMAVIRYLCYKSKQIIDKLDKVLPHNDYKNNLAEVIAIGGGTRNELWMEEKAKLLSQPLYINNIERAVSLGAALLGGIGAEVYKDYQDATAAIKRGKRRVN